MKKADTGSSKFIKKIGNGNIMNLSFRLTFEAALSLCIRIIKK